MRSRFSPSLVWRVIFAVCVLCADPILARADSADEQTDVERLSAEGVEAYRAGDHARALVLFGEAYRLDPAPNLLFNMARAYEKMGNDSQAHVHYGRFLASPEISDPAAARARSLLVATMERLDVAAALVAAAPPPIISATEGSLGGASVTTMSYRIPGWTAIGTGVALVSVGVACAVFAFGSADAFHATDDAVEKASHQESAESFALAADVTFGLGGISAAVGTLLLLFVDDPSESASSRSVVPAFWSEGGGVAARVHF